MCIYIYVYKGIYMQNNSQRHNDKGRGKTSFKKNMYLSFYCKGSKRLTQGFMRGSWRPNNILTPLR